VVGSCCEQGECSWTIAGTPSLLHLPSFTLLSL
jgi:hypothetical protein